MAKFYSLNLENVFSLILLVFAVWATWRIIRPLLMLAVMREIRGKVDWVTQCEKNTFIFDSRRTEISFVGGRREIFHGECPPVEPGKEVALTYNALTKKIHIFSQF